MVGENLMTKSTLYWDLSFSGSSYTFGTTQGHVLRTSYVYVTLCVRT